MDLYSRERALELDRADPLAAFRQQFVVAEPDVVYLDGNSLGRLGANVESRLRRAIAAEWGTDLIRGWNRGWWESPARVGDLIAALVGAAPGQVLVSDQTSVNLFKLAAAALGLRPGRRSIVTDSLNFPSDLYVLQGLAQLLDKGHEVVIVGSRDGDITPDLDALGAALDDGAALLTLSHVAFKSGYLYDIRLITDLAHRAGALVLWDLSHSVGVAPIELDACEVDLAIGCTYKYLNGGPGAPAFLYVNRRLHQQATSPIWGWWGAAQPFAFDLAYEPSAGIRRFLAGTAPMLSAIAMEAALEPVLEAGIARLREKSVALTQYALELIDARLIPLGFSVGSPRDPQRRGSHVSVRHPEGYRISRALVEGMKVIPDFREPDNIRLGFAPLYTSYAEAWDGIERMAQVVEGRRFEKFPASRSIVT